MKVVVINSIPQVKPRDLEVFAAGLQQYGEQVAASPVDLFGCDTMTPPRVEVLSDGQAVGTDVIPCHLDLTTGVDSAAAYHDKYKSGQPYIIVGYDSAKNGELFCADGESLLELAEHELAETMGNPRVNRWLQSTFLDKRSGRTWPLTCPERCDPFQGVYDKMTLKDGTVVGRVAWAYPAFFEQDRTVCEQLDSHGAASEPLTILPGGYQIVAALGRESNVFGHTSSVRPGGAQVIEHHAVAMPAHVRARKLSPGSRTMRIVASVA